MVLLTMTNSIMEGLHKLERPLESTKPDESEESILAVQHEEPSLDSPEIGKPISHGQIVDLLRQLKASGHSMYTLEQLLRGAHVYVPPPAPKPEPSAEYKALMTRLRREEEARSYERMVNPPLQAETFADRFPNSAHAFAEVNRPNAADIGDDEISYNEVHRQITLIFNFLVSIAGVAGTLWVAARWWSTPSRLFLTLGGSILVAIAEVVVYSGYMWRMGEAKKKQAGVKELKEVVETWVVGKDEEDEDEKVVLLKDKEGDFHETLRKRKTEQKDVT